MTAIRRLLVANRGEVAVRLLRGAADHGSVGVAVFSSDDASALHVERADEAVDLGSSGVRAYLDADRLVEAAVATGCDAVHPGYGFLSERADFASKVVAAGLVFVGPTPAQLELFGDKARARGFAAEQGVPVLPGLSRAASDEDAARFFADLPAGDSMVVKAVGGGGGRGMRIVREAGELSAALASCRSEAAAAFGCADLYVERLLARARHVEVQVAGDGKAVIVLGDRECSLQRRHQKMVEVAPSPGLSASLRRRLFDAAAAMASACRLQSLATFEFLVDAGGEAGEPFHFLEANARLQVEHTVTEEVTGLDLVVLQLRLAEGATLAEAGLPPGQEPAVRGTAMQVRVNAERLDADGAVRPASGTLTVFDVPSGPGVRVDTGTCAGLSVSPAFDSLLAKVIVHAPSSDPSVLVARARRALGEFRIDGVETNLSFLAALLARPELASWDVDTRFVDTHRAELVAAAALAPAGAGAELPVAAASQEDSVAVKAPMTGVVVRFEAREGDAVATGAPLLILEAMKMEHVVASPVAGVVRAVLVDEGATVVEGQALAFVEEGDVEAELRGEDEGVDLDRIREDLAESIERHRFGLDEARPEAVAKRRERGQRTARENVADLCDPGSFIEYGALAIAAQRRRRALDDLIRRTPGDGMVCGIGRINGDVFGPERSRAAVVAYDYTVLAGTQGLQNHRKKDRLFEVAFEQRLPVVVFTEGGGGRPGDTDGAGVAGLDCRAFQYFARLSGLVPLVGLNAGRCFAGNAALLGCCDVVIATEDSSIGMGGPAMIEGGGLGVFHPDEVGPIGVQGRNGVVDVVVRDEAEGVAVARRYLSYFQGRVATYEESDPRLLRSVIPENRLRVYDVRRVVELLADAGSVLELRAGFGVGMVTALARIEGRPLGIVANNPLHLAGAIDPEGADKAARFLQLCDAHDLPVLFLCDTPGIMVGPEVEARAMVRHAARLFVVGASLSVPFMTIVLRKGYGLGAQAMAGGSFHAPMFTVAWPTGEFGGMGLEGAVRLGFQKELAAVEDADQRRRLFDEMVARLYEVGKAISMASHFEIDDVIDPAESRRWIATALAAAPPPAPRSGKKRPCVDAW